MKVPKKVEECLRQILHDPECFSEVAFNWDGLFDAQGNKVTGPTGQQRQLLGGVREALRKGNPHFSIASGHGTGKTAALAQIILWFMFTRPNGLVPCTAPSSHQLSDVLWKEIGRWQQRLLPPFSTLLEITSDKVRFKNRLDGLGEALARTARKENPDALQGFHASDILYVIDEASGVPEEIFETVGGALTTPRAMAIMTGNPTRTSGTFYRSHHEDRCDWRTYQWSSLDSPLVSKDYGEKMSRRYGASSTIYKVRVLGMFPSGNPDALISLEVVMAACQREIPEQHDPMVYGVDPARFGTDETGFVKRKGREIVSVDGWGGLDTMQVAGRVAFEAQADAKKGQKPAMVFVDSIGIGAGVADRLRSMGFPVTDVQVSESPSDKEQYADLRSELWWQVREFFEAKTCKMPEDDLIISQLTDTNWTISTSGKIRVESKAERKRRLGVEQGKSPDRADALMLTFMTPVVRDAQYAAAQLTPEHFEDF